MNERNWFVLMVRVAGLFLVGMHLDSVRPVILVVYGWVKNPAAPTVE